MTKITEVHESADIRVVAALAREIWTEHYTAIIGDAQVAYMLDNLQSPDAIREQINEGMSYFRIDQAGTPVGYMAISMDRPESPALLSKLYVRADHRGAGLGRCALDVAENYCRSHGVTRLWLAVNRFNHSAIDWYTHMGFSTTGTRVHPIGGGFVMDDFIMEKSLLNTERQS